MGQQETQAKSEASLRQSLILSVILMVFAIGFSGCELAGDIFKAGVWVGAILVIGIIGLIIWMVSKAGS